MKDWPKYAPTTASDTVISQLGPTFFFCAQMVIFIIQLNQIVTEKEKKLREGMQMMGLWTSVYWISNYISGSILVLINALVTSESLLAMSFALSTLVRKSNTAVLLGIFMFIIGLLFENFVFSNSFVGFLWWEPHTVDIAGYYVLMFIPFFNFGHMFLDISTRTTGKLDSLTGTYIAGDGFAWDDLYTKTSSKLLPTYGGYTPDVPNPVDALGLMIMNVFFYLFLTWYLDCVIPNEFGKRLPPWFFLLPEYWGISLLKSKHNSQVSDVWLQRVMDGSSKKLNLVADVEEEGVSLERENALNKGVESL
ncbi:ATP-binding cassette sub- A member 1 [Nowakowskiella sp. JEL0078]|nr:ATP-binding cassette sub- A member 1 [Nowakowskiella sp. JEL0078]